MDVFEKKVRALAQKSKIAAIEQGKASTADKNRALTAIAAALRDHVSDIIAANGKDVRAAHTSGIAVSLIDRLTLGKKRIENLAQAVDAVVELQDPVGDVIRGSILPNGLDARQVRVPLGVVGIIYEARPNVTVDVVALGLKGGNSIILRGGSLSAHTNQYLVTLMRDAIKAAGFDPNSVQSIDSLGRQGAVALMKAQGFVDVLIPRGGHNLIQTVLKEATVPVIETGEGNVHIFVDKTAGRDMVSEIAINAKLQRPSVCNAVETLLIHQDYPHTISLLTALYEAGATIHADRQAMALCRDNIAMIEATEADWSKEYHSSDIAVRMIPGIDEALEHIAMYSTRHTEAILTTDIFNAQRFVKEVDSAAVVVNASTRFIDGGELGLGAELGISTQKLHARGPMGLNELTSTQWIITGTGQIRQ